MYGTLRRIKGFVTECFQNYSKLFYIYQNRILRDQTQLNSLYARFNQFIELMLFKLLNAYSRANWKFYFNFAVFDFNTVGHPLIYSFSEIPCLSTDLIFKLLARSSTQISTSTQLIQDGRLQLSAVFQIFSVLSVRGVILTVRELSTNRIYQIHHDRDSNPLLTPSFDRGPASDPIDSDPDPEPKDANPIENERAPGLNLEPASNPDNALIRTRSGRVSRPRRDPDYEYQLPLIEVPLVPSCYSQSASSHTNPPRSNASRRHANFEPSALLQSMQTQAEIVDALEEAGERVCFLVDRGMNAMLLRETGTLYVFDEAKNDFVNLCDQRTLTSDRKRQRTSRPPNFCELLSDDVMLPWQEIDFPGFTEGRHKRRYYGFTPEWRNYAIQQAKEEKSCSEPALPTVAQPEPEPERDSRLKREPEPELEPTRSRTPSGSHSRTPSGSRSRTPSGSQHQEPTRTSEYRSHGGPSGTTSRNGYVYTTEGGDSGGGESGRIRPAGGTANSPGDAGVKTN